MKDKVILPFDIDPRYKTFAYLFFYNGIISGNSHLADDWIISHWLDLIIKDTSLGICNREKSFFDTAPLMIENSHNIYYNELVENPEQVIEKILTYILDDNYIEGSFDEYEISACSAYQCYHMTHYYNIYGYDNEKHLFYAFGYTKNKKLEPFTISYNEFVKAVLACGCDNNYISLIKYNNKFRCEFDWNSVHVSMSDFLNSKCSKVLFDNQYLFGIEAQTTYLNQVIDVFNTNDGLDLRNCRLLKEYKNTVHEVIKRHPDYKKIKELSFYKEIYDIYEQQHNMGIKYRVTNEIGIIGRMIDMLKYAFEKEEIILRTLFH